MKLLLLYWGIMAVCYFAAGKLKKTGRDFGFLNPVLNVVVFFMVFLMGMKMGANEEVTSSLGTIGVQSLVITLFTVAGSMVFVTVVRRVMGIDRQGLTAEQRKVTGQQKTSADNPDENQGEDKKEKNDMSGELGLTAGILVSVVAGMLLGCFAVPRLFIVENFQETSGNYLVAGLCLLLAIIGFNMGLEGTIVKSIKAAGLRIIVIPVAAIAGSLLFGAVYGIVSPLSVREAMAVSAGFGWYTFAPTVISEAGYAVAGAVSFMHNVIRETAGIILVPLAARIFGYVEATSITGVAAMDICVPVVEKSCNSQTVIYSFVTGLMMSLAVPLLVPLLVG